MNHDERAGADKLNTKIAIAHRVYTVPRNAFEPKPARYRFAVNRKRGTRQRRGTERHDVNPPANLAEPLAIAGQHFEVSQTPVCEEYRLGALQMRITGKDRFGVGLSEVQQGGLS